MNKLEQLKKEYLQTRKDKTVVKTGVLGVLLGEVQTQMKNSSDKEDDILEVCAKKMHNAAKSNAKDVSEDLAESYILEMEYLEPYLPQTMSEGEILKVIQNSDVGEMPTFGARMGRAMSLLKGRADGSDVKRVVQKFYN